MLEEMKPTFEMDVEVKIPDNMPKVEHNLDKLEEYAENINKHYSKLIIQEKDIKDAENEKAKLNKLIEQVKRLRIDSIKKYKQPIEDFEATAKRVESLLGEASDTIKSTLNVFDEKRQQEKLDKVINPIMSTIISEAFVKGHLINPEVIETNPKWFNKTYKEEDIEKDIQDQVDIIIKDEENKAKDILVIRNTVDISGKNINVEKYIERYNYTRDLASILNDINNEIQNIENLNLTYNVSHETLTEEKPQGYTISLRGTFEQVSKIRDYARELGMEEI